MMCFLLAEIGQMYKEYIIMKVFVLQNSDGPCTRIVFSLMVTLICLLRLTTEPAIFFCVRSKLVDFC
jgi:hypothetical protein